VVKGEPDLLSLPQPFDMEKMSGFKMHRGASRVLKFRISTAQENRIFKVVTVNADSPQKVLQQQEFHNKIHLTRSSPDATMDQS